MGRQKTQKSQHDTKQDLCCFEFLHHRNLQTLQIMTDAQDINPLIYYGLQYNSYFYCLTGTYR